MSYSPKYRYIPPAGAHILTRFYDAFCSIAGLGKDFKRKILQSTDIWDGSVIIDVGCGTGVLLEVAKEGFPQSRIIGIDPDARSLAIAERRLKGKGLHAELIEGFAESLDLPDASVDFCFSTLAFHHMPDAIKKRALEEIHRVLKKGGLVVITDFGETDSWLIRRMVFFENAEYIKGNFKGMIRTHLTDIGFYNIRTVNKKFPAIQTIVAKK